MNFLTETVLPKVLCALPPMAAMVPVCWLYSHWNSKLFTIDNFLSMFLDYSGTFDPIIHAKSIAEVNEARKVFVERDVKGWTDVSAHLLVVASFCPLVLVLRVLRVRSLCHRPSSSSRA